MKALYTIGSTGIETAVNDKGLCIYTGKPVEPKGGQIVAGLEEIMPMIQEAEEVKYLRNGGWCAETMEEWYNALECLPPEEWRMVDGVEIFRMSEYTAGDITVHHARYNGKCWQRLARTTTGYETLSAEIKNLEQ
jgi:hypothetical protein